MLLTRQHKKQLMSRVHKIKPVVMIGNKGLTENVIEEINNALNAHELIKIRISAADKETKLQMIEEICKRTQSAEVLAIGHIVSIYRQRKPEYNS